MKTVRRILQRLLNDRKRLTYREEKEYIDSFPEPKDDIDRTRFHYLCVYHSMNKCVIILLNAVGIILVIPILLYLSIITVTSLFGKKDVSHHKALLINSDNRAGKHFDYDDRFPRDLLNEYGEVFQLNYKQYPIISEGRISAAVLCLWSAYILRHPLSGWTNCHSLIHLAVINGIITKYRPQIVVNSRVEINYMSSLITCFCERNGVEYACFMHGELLANIELGFVRFSRFYIWDEHYISLLKWARADKSCFVIYIPDIFLKQQGDEKGNPLFDYTYYMTGTAEGIVENYEVICQSVLALHAKGFKVKIRPHPRWSDIETVKELLKDTGVMVESSDTKMMESLNSTRNSIGIMSTTLLESFYSGKGIIIDDIANPALFYELENRLYILLEKPHTKLSELLNQ